MSPSSARTNSAQYAKILELEDLPANPPGRPTAPASAPDSPNSMKNTNGSIFVITPSPVPAEISEAALDTILDFGDRTATTTPMLASPNP